MVVACEVIKLAPIATRPTRLLDTAGFELTPPELIEHVVTEEGGYLAEEIRARRPNAVLPSGLQSLASS